MVYKVPMEIYIQTLSDFKQGKVYVIELFYKQRPKKAYQSHGSFCFIPVDHYCTIRVYLEYNQI